jgi:HAD superfamily hydrolase (TIGR01509 family)
VIKLVIFDLDGVLVDSKEIHFEALNKALAKVGSQYVISKEDHLRQFDGLNTNKKLAILYETRGLPAREFPNVWNDKQSFTRELLWKLSPDQHKIDVCKALDSLGVKIYCCSNAIADTVRCTLHKLGLTPYIRKAFSNEDVNRPKPAGEIYTRACLDAGVDPSETLVVEDSQIGRQAVHNSGCHLFPVENSTSWTKEELLRAVNDPNTIKAPAKWVNKRLNVVIPMAGAGSRFEKAGYSFPKPLIEVRGKPMIQVVVDNLGLDANFIFIAQYKHIQQYNLKTLLNLIAPDCTLVGIDGVSQGAACTVLRAERYFRGKDPLVIANSDQFLEWNPSDFYYAMEADKGIDGGIITFKATHPKWSFVKVEDGYIQEVAEKRPISDNATAGIYYWKHGDDFIAAANDMIEKEVRVNNEFYVAPVFNQAIEAGKKFKPFQIDKMHGIGTPEDLQTFLTDYKGVV